MLKKESLQYIEEFLTIDAKENGLRPKSIQNRGNILNAFVSFLGEKEMTLETAREYIASLFPRCEPSTIGSYLKKLRAFGNFCVEREYIAVNFFKQIKPPKVKRKVLVLVSQKTADEIIMAGTNVNHPSPHHAQINRAMRTALRFALRTGLRIDELCNLKPENFSIEDDEPFFDFISKGGNLDRLPFPPGMAEEVTP